MIDVLHDIGLWIKLVLLVRHDQEQLYERKTYMLKSLHNVQLVLDFSVKNASLQKIFGL